MRIVIATGGTGGHIFPALQTACVLRDRGHEVIFAGVLALSEEKVKAQGFKTIVIKARGLTNRSLTGLLQFSFFMLQAIGSAIQALGQTQPDKVIGFGGYGSFAVVLAARLLHIPTMIHEQNMVPGKANRLLAKVVKKVAISFLETQNYLNPHKIVLTGCPCHQQRSLESRENLLQKFSLEADRATILLLGGSQGSQKLNEVFFAMMSSGGQHRPVQAIHMTGAKEYLLYTTKYQNSSLPVKVFEFISPIEEAYAIADVVIARAGAATVWELGFFAKPSILVPYPLADGHQKYNAQLLVRGGLAQMIEQKDLTADILKKAVQSLLETKFDRQALFSNHPDQELALAVENL
ncbi:MAG: undecaprenyldiphospho-muramoylpentapeptide beta-N-acetylglucosaminyltransferase [Candidatus Omnitrophica bacterium]|nr:undecaprenyldiphospho-muramoylpentapeptide beta-N-acetylglucosaminyltransferase [Candidatus Omnitrophota bacterium]